MSRLYCCLVLWLACLLSWPAIAADTLGASTLSGAVGGVADIINLSPRVVLTAPMEGARFNVPATFTVTATATDPIGGIARVEFYSGGTILIGTAASAPYSITWSNIPAGGYSLTAKAIGNLGESTTSAAVSITVTEPPPPNSPPTVNLTSPTAGVSFQAPATINLAASAADADGSIAKVEFYRDTVLLGTATAAPYAYTWSNVPAGSYTLTAKATDNLGATTTSAPVSILVNALSLTLTSPADGATVAGDRVTVSGNFQAPPHAGIAVNGVAATVSGSDFYAFSVPIRTGTQTLTATLTTLDGQTASQSISVTGGPAPGVQLRAEPQSGPAPLTVSFTIANSTGSPVQTVEIDSDGDGAFEASTVGGFNLLFPTPGMYRTVVMVRLADGTAYLQSLPIVVQDVAQIDALLRGVYLDMLDRLKAGDITGALNAVTASVYDKYSAVFNALGADLPAAVDVLGTLRNGRIGDDWAEYLIVRDTPERPPGFPDLLHPGRRRGLAHRRDVRLRKTT